MTNIKNLKKGLAVIVIDHNDFEKILPFINGARAEIDPSIDLFFVYDNLLSDDEIKKVNENIKVINGENVGKLKAILNASEFVEKEYIKIIDSDDCINFKELKKLNEILITKSDETFYWHTAAKVYKGSRLYGVQTLDEDELEELLNSSRDVEWLKIPNAQSILNTRLLKKINSVSNKLERQNFFNDDFLSMSMKLMTNSVEKINLRPYIQFHGFGQTSIPAYVNKPKQKAFVDFYKNLSNLKDLDLNFDNLGYSFDVYRSNLKKQSKQFGPFKSKKIYKKAKIELEKFWYE